MFNSRQIPNRLRQLGRLTCLAMIMSISSSGLALVTKGAEPWADSRLNVTRDLEFWFDALRAKGPETAPADGKLSTWQDASGHGRQLSQSSASARPTLLKVGTEAVVRFDGRDDVFHLAGPQAERKNVTIFVVAAPRYNPGAFAGVLALNARDQRDFVSGICLDQGPAPSARFGTLNVEGRGFTSWKNLLKTDRRFGSLTILAVTMDERTVRLEVDGQTALSRPRDDQPISIDELTLGARFYEHGPGPQHVQGCGAWDVAEVLVYGRSLTPTEMGDVNTYFRTRYESLKNSLPPDPEAPAESLKPVADPPPIQVFVPGFEVRELPLDLTNVNNLLYRHDGTLMALAYDGRIWSLRDTDGDGLEDKAELFWDSHGTLRSPIGMDVTPPGYPHGDGVAIASKSRCVLIVDTDSDGKGDKEIVVADGWKDKNHQIDAIGIAIDPRDGAVFFGRGTADYTNAYLKGNDGKARYDLNDEMGTIQRVSPDLKSRKIVATGIRFSVGLRFDRYGELFATDQEGATWLPNGNPLDELLHIRQGRHYGFPPRHPAHLPNVIDEPSVFDYAPQHQSLCGFAFNEPVVRGGKTFGPDFWAGDAIVTGESRGKLYRTKLVRTDHGYVGQNTLIAALNHLTIDCCLAPDGSLRVACHSGGPDWGSGPTGKGKLFSIRYADRQQPQPVVVWPNGPREVHVEFDRPLDPASLGELQKSIRLTSGNFVGAGDRFETLWPGYAVVNAEKLSPRKDLAVRAVSVTPDRRSLVITTDPQRQAVRFAMQLPGMGRPARDRSNPTSQMPEIDLAWDLTGVEAEWTPVSGELAWKGWLPHADLAVARELTAGSATHDALWQYMKGPGELRMKFRLDLRKMLQPAIQPGARLDFEYPPETVTVRFSSSGKIQLDSPAEHRSNGNSAEINVDNSKTEMVDFEFRSKFLAGEPRISIQFSTAADPMPRTLPLRRFFVPWSAIGEESRSEPSSKPEIPEIAGGRWSRGRKVFFGDSASCSKCHSVHGQGGIIGPDLSNLRHRDYASVLRDISLPSFALNPDHLSYTVEMKTGQILTGTVRIHGDRVIVGDTEGRETSLVREEVDRLSPSPASIMPEGLPQRIGPDNMRDLMAFLLTEGPAMPDYGPLTAPVPRRMSEIRAILEGAPAPPPVARNLKIVLVGGRKDHGPGEHDYPAWQKAWLELLSIDKKIEMEIADSWPTVEQIRSADVLVFFQQGTWNEDRAADLDRFLARGGGAVYLHYAVDGGKDPSGFAKRIGLAWESGRSKYRHGPLELKFTKIASNPITRNFSNLVLHDESYWNLAGDASDVNILAEGLEDGKPQPLVWTKETGKGRVFVSIPGHFSWSFDDPLFRILILRGMAWAAREPVDRFDSLILTGARVDR
ncbi:hypothetical protein GC170_16120 [bacterium]|nr:hypothetical protein [bacterium]